MYDTARIRFHGSLLAIKPLRKSQGKLKMNSRGVTSKHCGGDSGSVECHPKFESGKRKGSGGRRRRIGRFVNCKPLIPLPTSQLPDNETWPQRLFSKECRRCDLPLYLSRLDFFKSSVYIVRVSERICTLWVSDFGCAPSVSTLRGAILKLAACGWRGVSSANDSEYAVLMGWSPAPHVPQVLSLRYRRPHR